MTLGELKKTIGSFPDHLEVELMVGEARFETAVAHGEDKTKFIIRAFIGTKPEKLK